MIVNGRWVKGDGKQGVFWMFDGRYGGQVGAQGRCAPCGQDTSSNWVGRWSLDWTLDPGTCKREFGPCVSLA